jgi:hypothetical protein
LVGNTANATFPTNGPVWFPCCEIEHSNPM